MRDLAGPTPVADTPVIFANCSALPEGRSLQPPGLMSALMRVGLLWPKGFLCRAPLRQLGIVGGVGLQRRARVRGGADAALGSGQPPPWLGRGTRARFPSNESADLQQCWTLIDDRLER